MISNFKVFGVFISILLTINFHGKNTILIDDFQSHSVDSFPDEWKGRKKKAKKEYKVESEDGNQFLSAKSDNSDMFILKKCTIDATEFQYINWKWRVNEIPEGGNETKKKMCDAPAAISIVFRLSKWRPKALKYTFSSTLEPETLGKSPYSKWPARCDIMVLRNANDGLKTWLSEKRNIVEDYKKVYGVEDVDNLKIEGIVIMTDSDNTHTYAAADYDDIFFSKD